MVMADSIPQFHKELWFFESVMEDIPTSVIVTDFTPKIIYVNGATEELFGYTKEEMIGSNPGMYNAEPGANEIQKNIYKTVMNGKVWSGRILNKRSSGELFINNLTVRLLKNKDGEDIGLIGFQEDITESICAAKNAQESKDKFENIFLRSPTGMYLYELNDDNELILTGSNPAADKFTGIKNTELIGAILEDAFPSLKDTEIAKRYKIAAGDGISWHTISYAYRDDRIDGIFDVWVFQLSPRKIAVQFIEISERIKAEEELKKSNAELEEFAYVASHDLQEPLRVVASYCQLLRAGYYDDLDDEGQRYVNYAVDSAVRMKTLIKELLDFSRVGRRDKPFEYVSVRDILQEVMSDYQMVIDDSNAKIIIDDDLPTVFAVRFRMKQLIANIVSNALKFKSDRSPIINIGCCNEGHFWLFYIKDNGIGIDSQFFDRIFGIFKRLYSRDEYPGTGIGLALCKRIIETHGGKIWVDSEENNGTCIYFTIPKPAEITEVINL